MKKIIIILFLSSFFIPVYATTNWKLKKDKDGIKIYSGSVPNTNIKAIKAEYVLTTSCSELTALLLNAKAHKQWVYNTATSYVIKEVTAQEQIYYSEVSMPWPLTNRDIVVNLKISQNTVTKVMTVIAAAVPGYVPLKKGTIRVRSSTAIWKITPIGSGQVKVDYTAQADPGGSVPAWAVNTFCDTGPFETFKELKKVLLAGNYKSAHFDFITN
jgi:hypothetical protein